MGQERVVEVLGAGEDVATALARMGVDLGRPVVVLFGGADGIEDETSRRLYPIIRDGVVAVADDLGAVIVDGGTLSGVMALAGRSRAELAAGVQLVGVAPAERVEVRGIEQATGSTRLEPNHSHHLLVPGQEWGDESPTLLAVARAIAGAEPVVAVLVDGGPIALAESLEAAANGWPLVTVDGSGRMADLVAAYARGSKTVRLALDAELVYVTDINTGPAALAKQVRTLLMPSSTMAPSSSASPQN